MNKCKLINVEGLYLLVTNTTCIEDIVKFCLGLQPRISILKKGVQVGFYKLKLKFVYQPLNEDFYIINMSNEFKIFSKKEFEKLFIIIND